MNEKDKIISIAKEQEGYLEKKSNKDLDDKYKNAGNNNYTKFARDLDNIKGFYNGKKQGYAWCDVFVDWCFVQAVGVDRAKELLCQPSNSLGAGVGYSADYYKKNNQFYPSNPQIGDQIFFKNTKGSRTHTGLVYQVDKNYVYTIEGNTSSDSGVVANGGCVRLKKYSLNYKYIYGYGRPKYKIEEKKITEKSFNSDTYVFLKDKYVRKTPIVANNKIKYSNFPKTGSASTLTQKKLIKDLNGYAKIKKDASLFLSKFSTDVKGNIWGMYKGIYSNVWICVYDSTGFQVK